MAPGFLGDTWRPSRKLRALMMGETDWEDADQSIRSMASFHIFHAAKQICAEKDRTKRQQMLSRIPENIRPKVEDEVRRLWSSR